MSRRYKFIEKHIMGKKPTLCLNAGMFSFPHGVVRERNCIEFMGSPQQTKTKCFKVKDIF